jgi:hypothetical protein
MITSLRSQVAGGNMKSKKIVALLGDERPRARNRLFILGQGRSAGGCGLTPDGTADMNEVQVAYLGNGGGGNGTLYYRGNAYPFTTAGLGVGGIGASTVDAQGEVYKLPDLSRFPGSYGQASYSFAFGTASSGNLWMQNQAGVILNGGSATFRPPTAEFDPPAAVAVAAVGRRSAAA